MENSNQTFEMLLPQNSVEVWKVPLSKATAVTTWQRILSPAEREKADKFRLDSDRDKYRTAHVALRQILALHTNLPPEELQFNTNEFGKPFLGNCTQIEFNMSHSGALALVAICRDRRVGIDIELIRPEAVTEGVAERFFSTGEIRKLSTLSGGEVVKAFFRCWTRKEAYLKAIGCGISDKDLATSEVSLLEGEPPAILKATTSPDRRRAWSVFHLEIAEGYASALVAEGSNVQVFHRTWPTMFAPELDVRSG